MTIGEAASKISGELRSKYPQVSWKEICGLRAILAHQYFSVDLDVIWHAVSTDLVPLRSQIEDILRAEFPN